MASRRVAVGSASGLHAPPAALFVQAATAAPVKVTIRVAGDRTVDSRSLLSVLSLGVMSGTEVVLEAEGDGAEEAVVALAELLARDLDAPDRTPDRGPDAAAPHGQTPATTPAGGARRRRTRAAERPKPPQAGGLGPGTVGTG